MSARTTFFAAGLVALLACERYGEDAKEPSPGEALPEASVDDVVLAEGSSGPTSFVFTVTLSKPSSDTVTVAYATANGTATAPDDYESKAGTLVFSPGTTVQTVTVPVLGETAVEADETFTLTLGSPTNATVKKAVGTATIENDDGVREVSIAAASAPEGSALAFTLTLSQPSAEPVSVDWTIADVTTTPADYQSVVSGTVVFAPGTTSQQLSIASAVDVLDEVDETFEVRLSNPSKGATVAGPAGVGTIVDNDPTPSLTFAAPNAQRPEGDSASVVQFDVSLSAPSGRVVTVQYVTEDIDATSIGATRDYDPAAGTLTFQPGVTKVPISVTLRGDTTNEGNEKFRIVLSGPSGATLGADSTLTVTITNDD